MAHPVGNITKLGMDGYGVHLGGDFSGKAGTVVVTPPDDTARTSHVWDRWFLPGGFGRWATQGKGYSR